MAIIIDQEQKLITPHTKNSHYSDTTGIRDLEQAAEHIAANALYQIEVDHVAEVTFDREMVMKLLEA